VVVSAARDKTVRSWNRTKANDFQQHNVYLGHSHYVNAVAYLPPSAAHPNGMLSTAVAIGIQRSLINAASNHCRTHCVLRV
jgi:hypothetical protein